MYLVCIWSFGFLSEVTHLDSFMCHCVICVGASTCMKHERGAKCVIMWFVWGLAPAWNRWKKSQMCHCVVASTCMKQMKGAPNVSLWFAWWLAPDEGGAKCVIVWFAWWLAPAWNRWKRSQMCHCVICVVASTCMKQMKEEPHVSLCDLRGG